MHTSFRIAQLTDPRVAEADKLLRRCVHCGLCTAVCPTYVLLADERDSPRGRIYIMKEMFERGEGATPEARHHLDRCLSCLSCMTTCPSGVDYMHLADIAREHIESTGNRPLKDRLLRRVLANVLPSPRRFRVALKLALWGKPFVGLLRRFGLGEVAAMLELAPETLPRSARYEGPGTAATTVERRGRVLLADGCAQQVLRPDINDATIRLLARGGIDVTVAAGAGCCGALAHHLGQEEAALEQVRRNVDAWSKEIGKDPVQAIISNASGCGTMIKDYGYLLRRDSEYAERAKRVSDLARDVVEFAAGFGLGPAKRWSSLRVAYHSACSLQHGQRVKEEPKTLLLNAGFSVVEPPEGHICCGSAGTYNILQPAIANELRDRKLRNIKSVKPDIVAAGNIGCISQLAAGLDVPIVHTVELLDWAHGGPVPSGLEQLAAYATDVPPPRRVVDDFIDA